ncbi:glycosyltransferase family 2 protein [Roseobacter sp. N2S]|uniref:glycosyltransferase family 2 protein n=1 Tax=Roseobacter sp. N2S TaxID=2663844 RepID=UPI002856C641|nr:glycosyltransferase family 2 protein [Roseobacter sp. N2S]MDR6267658.1 hypothetical protein [Roseobacter sp. N2S]
MCTTPPTVSVDAELTVIIVSYNTCDMTLKAVETLYANTHRTQFQCVVLDNASEDGSAEAIATAFPQVEVIASPDNLGFARANNVVAAKSTTPYLLLLNPDTETHAGAIDALMDFAKSQPQGGIWGGRTVFPDGSLNIGSCLARPTPRSLFFRALGMSTLFPKSEFFNPETYGSWKRDSVREVDVVVGCLLLITRSLWDELGGFNLKYYMYGEDTDLCLRARTLGWRPMITPTAQIMHIVGASTKKNDKKAVSVMKARLSLVKDHWPSWQVHLGIFLMWLWSLLRFIVTRPFARSSHPRLRKSAERWKYLWDCRSEWLSGY